MGFVWKEVLNIFGGDVPSGFSAEQVIRHLLVQIFTVDSCLRRGLIVAAINYNQGGWHHPDGPLGSAAATPAQEASLKQLWKQLKIFIDEKSKPGVPRVWDGLQSLMNSGFRTQVRLWTSALTRFFQGCHRQIMEVSLTFWRYCLSLLLKRSGIQRSCLSKSLKGCHLGPVFGVAESCESPLGPRPGAHGRPGPQNWRDEDGQRCLWQNQAI